MRHKHRAKPLLTFLHMLQSEDFQDSTLTREYLEREKNTELENFHKIAKRQSAIGSYLFGKEANDLLDKLNLKEELQINVEAPSEVANTLERRVELKELEEQRDDEIIQQLSDYENGFPLLLARVKESMNSSKEAANFLRKRAQIEQEYATQLMKLGSSYKNPITNNPREKPKGQSYQKQWNEFEKLHWKLGETRMQFATSIYEMADNIHVLYKNTERSRKQLKDSCNRHLKELHESEVAMEKARLKFENSTDDWERTQGIEKSSMKKSQSASKGLQNPYQILKQKIQQDLKLYPKTEEEARQKAANANETYKVSLTQANQMRQQYFNSHLPRFIRALKETNVDCDEGLYKYLVKYAKCIESFVMVEATMLSPLDESELGLLGLVEKIDNRGDFQFFMVQNLGKESMLNKNDHQYVSYLKPIAESQLTPTSPNRTSSLVNLPTPTSPLIVGNYFGSDLVRIMESDPEQTLVPKLVSNCIDYIEASGLKQEGLYRLSGSSIQTQKLKTFLDKDPLFPLEDVVHDVHCVTGVLKLFFRELSDPLFPKSCYAQLLDAARIEDPRLRLIQIHEIINELQDVNYATLKSLACHLAKVSSLQTENKMNESNLGIVWGPTLIDSGNKVDAGNFKYSSLVIEVIISNCDQIFDVDE